MSITDRVQTGAQPALDQQAIEDFMQVGARRAAALLRTLANENRLLILCLLLEYEELAVGALVEHMPLSQSALSQHLAVLRSADVVAYRRQAQTLYYQIADHDVVRVLAVLKQIFCP